MTDSGGGVETVLLEIDGVAKELHVGGERCRRPFVYAAPCVVDGVIGLDDQGLAPGARSVFATFIDVAGNRTYSGPHTIRIPNPGTEQLPAPRVGTVITDGRARRRVPYRATTLSGVVRDHEGFPIADAPVLVATRVASRPWRQIAPARTDHQGKFKVIVPKGPSREVRLSYFDAASIVQLLVPAPLKLTTDRRATRNGRTITFHGRVPESGGARTRVTLQAWARGKWVPFRTVELRKGSFRARYRFTGTYATTRYRFRAVIAGDPSFVFERGASSSVTVVVRPTGRAR
jgi:hypothetical protein